MTVRRIADIALIGGFLLAIVLPFADSWLRLDSTPPLGELRTAAPRPPLPKDVSTLATFGKEFDSYWNDNFGFRRSLIRAYNGAMVGLGASPSTEVVLGKDGWLFLASEHSIESYRATRPFSPDELAYWQRRLERRRTWLAERGIHYLFCVAPEKQTIYPEYLPDAINRVGATTRLGQLVAYLKGHSDFEILDLRDALLAAKAPAEQIYQRTDSHWNDRGALIAYEAIMTRLNRWLPALQAAPSSTFDARVREQPGGDLARMLSLEDRLREPRPELVPRTPRQARALGPDPNVVRSSFTTQVADTTLPRAVMFHDSFGNFLKPLLSEHFSRIVYSWTLNFEDPIVDREHPNVVIQEIAERSLMWIRASGSPP